MGDKAPRVIDASSAHRVAPGWTYGFAELTPGQDEAIAKAKKVTNPGCHATGAIALLRPLVDAGLLPKDWPVTITSVSGYSGGGKSMIEAYETGKAPAFEHYGLALEHKHLPEIELYSGLTRRPIFVPSVGNFRQGMLVSVPLHLDALPGKPTLAEIKAAFDKRYGGRKHVKVFASPENARLEPEALNGTNDIEIHVLGIRAAPAGGAGRQVRQPGQGRLGRGGAEPDADAGAVRNGPCFGRRHARPLHLLPSAAGKLSRRRARGGACGP